MGKITIVVLVAAGIVGVLWLSQQQRGPLWVSGYIESDEIRVGSRVGGRVSEVLVREGQKVARGDALVKLEPFDLRERRAGADANLAASRAALARLQAGYRPEEIEQARARRDRFQAVLAKLEAGSRPLEIKILEDRLAVARAELVRAEGEFTRLQKLKENSQAAQEEMDEATRFYDSAKARFAQASNELALAQEGTRKEEIAEAQAALAEAQQALALFEKGYRREDIAEAEAHVAAARATLDAMDRQIQELDVTSPCACVVEAVDLQPGDMVPVNAPVVSLLDPAVLWVRAFVPENRLDLALGRKASVRVDSFPQRRFAAHITFISRQAEFTPANVQTPEERSKQVFRIKAALDEGLDVLRPGMSADVLLEPES
ncbi:MAG TPA: HlyD family efflux transporter periplasmic adaptor subunit [Phycisphaerae bacterium]|nr:HlyD family efflux transporter periplasmic adaptor subunit [Phycisphaerae bacterium]HNU46270.1 HlyD family efflux transporter periplasmic adaptor subunit [Phycisphaerae bacterium]